MWLRNAKKYLVAITFSVVWILLSGFAGNSTVNAGNNSYAYQSYGKAGESLRMRSVDWHPNRYPFYSYHHHHYRYHPGWGYYGPYGYYHHRGYYGPNGFFFGWGY